MTIYEHVVHYFLPKIKDVDSLAPATRYIKLWRFAIILTSMISIIPLIVMTLFNYYHDQRAFSSEMNYKVSQILSNNKRTLEFLIEERQSALNLIVTEKKLEDLCSDESLTLILRNLNQAFPGYIDLGIINTGGDQLYYSGPYDLKGKNYKDQQWFHEVTLRGIYVSNVFMGYRNFPHFVITIKQENAPGDYFILRATIDMELINEQIYALDLDNETDAFIVNSEGILQTASRFYGGVLEKTSIDIPLHSRNSVVIDEVESGRRMVTRGYAYIQGTPFILMASTRIQNPLEHWISRRSELVWFVVIAMIIIFVIVVYRSSYMVNRLRDSDERRAKAFHNIEYTNKMATIGRMAASVAHEINNPLAIINEKAGLLKDIVTFDKDFPKKDKSLGLLDGVEQSVERCSKVTHRLLGFSRRMDVHKEMIDLEHLLKEVVGFLAKEAEHRNISINYIIPKDIPAVESDRGQLQQVFLNIVNNGIAAVKDGGVIDIAAQSLNQEMVTVSIKDNGVGISKENLTNIFEPFYSTKGEFGTGLGLSITKDIVEKLCGRIEVQSELNQGTEFKISLPVRQ